MSSLPPSQLYIDWCIEVFSTPFPVLHRLVHSYLLYPLPSSTSTNTFKSSLPPSQLYIDKCIHVFSTPFPALHRLVRSSLLYPLPSSTSTGTFMSSLPLSQLYIDWYIHVFSTPFPALHRLVRSWCQASPLPSSTSTSAFMSFQPHIDGCIHNRYVGYTMLAIIHSSTTKEHHKVLMSQRQKEVGVLMMVKMGEVFSSLLICYETCTWAWWGVIQYHLHVSTWCLYSLQFAATWHHKDEQVITYNKNTNITIFISHMVCSNLKKQDSNGDHY